MSDPDTRPNTGEPDTEVLVRIAGFLRKSPRFDTVVARPGDTPREVVADYDTGHFPPAVDRAYLTVRWFQTEDFSAHYAEQYEGGSSWEMRWDRHPNSHNSRGHVHPPPDADHPAADRSFPREWQTVLSAVLSTLDERIDSLWE